MADSTVTSAARLATLFGVPAAAVITVATLWLNGDEEVGQDGADGTEIRDVLLTRDARVYEGRLEGCNASSCDLEGRNYDRRTLGFVGLGVESVMPPVVVDPSRDEIRLRDGTTVHEQLAQIDDDRVFAGALNLERIQVEWIYLAPEQSEPSASPIDKREEPLPEPDSFGEEQDGSSGNEPASREPRPPRGQNAAFAGCPDDQPLGAWIWLRNDYQDFHPTSCQGTETHVVRFRLEPIPGSQQPDSAVALAYKASELRYTASTDGCFDVPGDDEYCNAEGVSVEGTLPLSEENLGYAQFYPLEPQLAFQYPAPGWVFELTTRCVRPNAPDFLTTLSGISEFDQTGLRIAPTSACETYHRCNEYCVAPTQCLGNEAFLPDCANHAERYAVIPFEGALVDGPDREESSACTASGSSQVRWRVCCGCAETGPPPDFDARDQCGGAAPQTAIAGRCQSELEAMIAALAPYLAEYSELMAAADENRDAFDQSQNWCAVYDGSKEILEAILTGGAGPAAEAGRALIYLRGLIGRVQNGTLAELLYPGEVSGFLEQYNKAKAIWFELTADELSKMQRDHDACAGKVPLEIRLKATKFLADLTAAKDVWHSKVAPGLNDLRSKGYECANADHAAWRACKADAECRVAPDDCGPEPSLDSAYDVP